MLLKTAPVTVAAPLALGLSSVKLESKFKESLLIAVLGYARIKNIKSNMPAVTGAFKNIVLGEIYKFE